MLGSRYLIEGRLGDGGMGTVYRARHIKVGRAFAIKVLHASLTTNPKVVARFQREAELAGRLSNKHVVAVVDLGVTDDGEHYMVMDFAPGAPLSHFINDGPMSEDHVIEIARQLCDGLQHAHEVGLIHRDFKPDNVIVETHANGTCTARIVDLGVAILREDAGDVEGDRLTTKGIVVGTPHYMAPEQARGQGVDHRLDLFALGLIIYEMLAGKLPFDGSGVEVARANLSSVTPPIGIRSPEVKVDPVLEAIVSKLLAKRPERRPATAHAAKQLIDLYIKDRTAAAAELGVTLVEDRPAMESLSMPPIQQLLIAGRSRSANQSAAPYANHSDAAADERERAVTTDKLPTRRSRPWIVVVAALLVGTLLSTLLWFSKSNPRKPAAAVATNDTIRDAALTAETERDAGVKQDEPPRILEIRDASIVIAEVPYDPRRLPRVPVDAATAPSHEPPSGTELAQLYGHVGRELTNLETKKGMDATIDLWPRYRWIRINEWLATPERRRSAAEMLQQLRDDIRKQDPLTIDRSTSPSLRGSDR